MALKKKQKNGKVGFVISIVVLLLGMTIGFLLLGTVYTGPVWVKLLVFIIYLIIVFFLIHFSKDFVTNFYSCEKKK